MKRWHKGCLVAAVALVVAALVAAHSQLAKMIAGMGLTPRIEAALEERLGGTIAVGGIDYRLWLLELTLVGVEAESADGSWRFSLPEARLRFTPIGNVSVVAIEPKITVRRADVGVGPRPSQVSDVIVENAIVRALTPDGFEPRASEVDVELFGDDGTARGTSDVTGKRFEVALTWDGSGLRVD